MMTEHRHKSKKKREILSSLEEYNLHMQVVTMFVPNLETARSRTTMKRENANVNIKEVTLRMKARFYQ